MWCLLGTGVQSGQTWSCSLHIQRVYRKQKCVLQGERMTAVLGLAIGNCHFGRSKNSNIKFQILKILFQDSYVAFVFNNIWEWVCQGDIFAHEKSYPLRQSVLLGKRKQLSWNSKNKHWTLLNCRLNGKDPHFTMALLPCQLCSPHSWHTQHISDL